MPTLVRAPEQLDASVRESAAKQGVSIHSWWIDAAKEKLAREKADLDTIARSINDDPILREVLNRLAQ